MTEQQKRRRTMLGLERLEDVLAMSASVPTAELAEVVVARAKPQAEIGMQAPTEELVMNYNGPVAAVVTLHRPLPNPGLPTPPRPGIPKPPVRPTLPAPGRSMPLVATTATAQAVTATQATTQAMPALQIAGQQVMTRASWKEVDVEKQFSSQYKSAVSDSLPNIPGFKKKASTEGLVVFGDKKNPWLRLDIKVKYVDKLFGWIKLGEVRVQGVIKLNDINANTVRSQLKVAGISLPIDYRKLANKVAEVTRANASALIAVL